MREVDDRRVADGKPGPVTRWLQETYAKVVRGQDPRYQDWLTYV